MSFRLRRTWGEADESGARNLVDAAATLRGIAAVRTGHVLPLGLEIRGGSRGPATEQRAPAQHFMIRDGGDYAAGLDERHGFGFCDDVIMLPTHGTSHIDALCHVWRDSTMYNGFAATEVTSSGARRCGIEKLAPIVTRGLFVDLADSADKAAERPISCAELVAAVERAGVTPEPGDALVVRSGWLAAWRAGRADPMRSAGLHHDCADWIVDRGFAIVAADNPAVEVLPSGHADTAVPLHLALMRGSGIYFVELLDLEELARASRSSFMLTIAPLRIRGGTASPVSPVAVL